MAPLSPTAVGALLKQKPGILGTVMGEVLYLFECTPRKVTLRRPDDKRCFKELPVQVDEEALFMAPMTHILQIYGEEVPCTGIAPALFKINNQWISLSPEPGSGLQPQELQVSEEPRLKFKAIQRISAEGIYTNEELYRAKEVMMHGMQRTAINNIIVGRVSGHNVTLQGIDVMHLFSEKNLAQLARNTVDRLWGWLKIIGSFTSGVLGIYFVLRVMKFAVEVAINAIALHRAVGCSLSILAAFWDTLAVLVMARHSRTNSPMPKQNDAQSQSLEKEEPLQAVIVVEQPKPLPGPPEAEAGSLRTSPPIPRAPALSIVPHARVQAQAMKPTEEQTPRIYL